MKRDRDLLEQPQSSSKMWPEPADTGMDELFAVLGYKVKSSDMADVAEKLQQLEMAMTMEDGASLSFTDTVHYNPSDLYGSVGTLLSEFTNYNQISHSSGPLPIYDDDLRAIPGDAILTNNQDNNNNNNNNTDTNNKRMKATSGSDFQLQPPPVRPMVLVDTQETGVRLVHTLMACAEAVQQENLKLADALMKHVGVLAVSQIGAMRKVATCFAEALARKIYKIFPLDSTSYSDVLHMHFYETGPYLKFAHFTSNQAILKSFTGSNKVHVIDFSLKQGMQWPELMQALARLPNGPPSFKLTAVGSDNNNTDSLQEVGWKLAQFANAVGVEFEFRWLVTNSLSDLDISMFDMKDDECVAVNSVFELHKLLARPDAVDKVFDMIKCMNPKIVTVVEQEANHNGDVFLERFNEALHYYSTMFDSLESAAETDNENVVMTEVYLGWQICNVVACEGVDRVERHETLSQWRVRMGSAGFEQVHMGSDAFKQASLLLAHSAGGDGYRVEENDGCLMLGWHTRPLITTSAWNFSSNGK